MSHNPNPFDFVTFASASPNLKSTKEWLSLDSLKTGYLELQVQALTPVHIVGTQEAKNTGHGQRQSREEGKPNFKILNSHFYRRHDQAFIPASSLRGLLRAFIETACNGWASQMTPFYLTEKSRHQIGFREISAPKDQFIDEQREKIDFNLDASLPKEHEPRVVKDVTTEKIDLASFLFGYVSPEKKEKSEEAQEASNSSWRGRIIIEDARIPADHLSGKTGPYRMPDVEDSAFMGGPHPSASSWWYQKPYGIQLRPVKHFKVCDFIGAGFRGRKFYYHQDPQSCVAWYLNDQNWKSRPDHRVYNFPIECLEVGKTTESFRLYFENVPAVLLKLLLLALQPGNRLRHKLGYGKAYGYGSINFIVKSGVVRNEQTAGATVSPVQETLNEIHNALWDEGKLNKIGIGQFLERESLKKLAPILWYQEPLSQMFTYPPFDAGGFLPIAREADLKAALPPTLAGKLSSTVRKVIDAEARAVAQNLAKQGRRAALHFEVYQESAEGYSQIQARKLEQAV